MDRRGDEFLKKLRATFRVEAREHIQALSSGLIALERTPDLGTQQEMVEAVFREVHSLKGAARAVNLADMERLCQALENLFAAWKRQELAPSPALFDTLHDAADTLDACVAATEAERAPDERLRLRALFQRLEGVRQGDPLPSRQAERGAVERARAAAPRPESPPPPAQEKLSLPQTVRIPAARLDALLLRAEEFVAAKLAALQRAAELRALRAELAAWKKEWARTRPGVHAWRRSGNDNGHGGNHHTDVAAQVAPLLEFLERGENRVKSLDGRLAALTKSAEEDQRALGRMVDDLRREGQQPG